MVVQHPRPRDLLMQQLEREREGEGVVPSVTTDNGWRRLSGQGGPKEPCRRCLYTSHADELEVIPSTGIPSHVCGLVSTHYKQPALVAIATTAYSRPLQLQASVTITTIQQTLVAIAATAYSRSWLL